MNRAELPAQSRSQGESRMRIVNRTEEDLAANRKPQLASIDDLRIEEPPPRKRQRRTVRLAFGVLIIMVLGGTAWVLHANLRPSIAPVDVYVVPASQSAAPGGSGFTAGGYLEVIPPGPVVVSTMIEGRVKSLRAVPGQTITQGDELARLDDVVYRQELDVQQAAVALAKAKLARLEAGFRTEEIAQAKANLDRAQGWLEKAKADEERLKPLAEAGTVAGKTYLTAVAELRAAQADVSARKAELDLRTKGYRKEDIAIARAESEQAEAELRRTQWKLEQCVIKAPISGVVFQQLVQPGDWVSANQRGEHRGALLTLALPSQIQAWVDVNQRDIGSVHVGQDVRLVTDANPERPINCRVERILPTANLQKNTVQVKVQIPKPPADFRPEMSVQVTFIPRGENASQVSSVVSVPATAVVTQSETTGVYVLLDGQAHFRQMTTGNEVDGMVTVLSGLNAGDRVILSPQSLTDGQLVEIRK